MKYKVQVAYINMNGNVVHTGVYDEKDIDIAEARKRSIITLVDTNIQEAKLPEIDTVKTIDIGTITYTGGSSVKEIKIEPTVSSVKLLPIKINQVEQKDIESIKYVGKATAEKVIAKRKEEEFKSYIDLDTRVPLRLGKKWQDIAYITFDSVLPMRNDNSIQYI